MVESVLYCTILYLLRGVGACGLAATATATLAGRRGAVPPLPDAGAALAFAGVLSTLASRYVGHLRSGSRSYLIFMLLSISVTLMSRFTLNLHDREAWLQGDTDLHTSESACVVERGPLEFRVTDCTATSGRDDTGISRRTPRTPTFDV